MAPSFHFDPRFSVFIADIDEQIVWIPQGSLWSAENVQHVTNKGLELGYDMEYSLRKSRMALKFDYTYVSSVNSNKSMQNDASSGKQQIYTPRNRAVAKLSYSIGKFYSYLNTSYTGITYCTRDNSEELPPNTLLDLGLRYRFTTWHKAGLELGGTINNLLDHAYQFIQYYPAPGRNFSIELICKIY
jgi:iron complex outermembrane receptor protein